MKNDNQCVGLLAFGENLHCSDYYMLKWQASQEKIQNPADVGHSCKAHTTDEFLLPVILFICHAATQ